MARNDGFKGSVSLMGHSLGSLILFDLLSHQGGQSEPADAAPIVKPKFQDDLNLKQIFELLDISDFIGVFSDAGIDTEDFLTCSEDDLKEAGIPPGPRKKLIKYIEDRKSNAENKLSGLEEFQRSSVTSDVKYTVGPAGTGQPSVHYPMLSFQPAAFYALGSPIAMFLAVRGINSLGSNFEFPTCPRFFNIFHPYDPVAYRVESLINSDFSKLRPVVIPHHKGRKRMHLELKDTVTKLMTTDIKKTILDSVSATLSTVYNIATGTSSQPVEEPKVQEALEDTMNKQAEEEDEADATNPRFLDAMLNRGNRIDYVLQEAPFESFNEYLFALASHLCYWESEDTCLMILKDIYDQAGIFADDANALMLPPRHQQSPPLSMGTGSSGQFPPPPRPTEQSKTPILAPPPTPMGGSMKGPSMLQSPTPILAPPPTPMGGSMQGPPILQSATPILAPPPTPMGGTMQGPPTLQNKPSYSVPPSTIGGPPAAIPKTPSFSQTTPTIGVFATPSPVNAPSGPAPLMMAPPPTSTPIVPRPPGSLTSSGSYPRPVQQPSVTQSGGMDPTAPVMGSKPVGPPPIGGYFQPK